MSVIVIDQMQLLWIHVDCCTEIGVCIRCLKKVFRFFFRGLMMSLVRLYLNKAIDESL